LAHIDAGRHDQVSTTQRRSARAGSRFGANDDRVARDEVRFSYRRVRIQDRDLIVVSKCERRQMMKPKLLGQGVSQIADRVVGDDAHSQVLLRTSPGVGLARRLDCDQKLKTTAGSFHPLALRSPTPASIATAASLRQWLVAKAEPSLRDNHLRWRQILTT
jgi:hypothetical protein